MGNSPKKVLFIITKGNFGGAQRYVFDLATSITKQGFISTVAFGEAALLKKKLEGKNIATRVIRSFQRDINPFLEIKALKEILSVIREVNPDVIHVNSSKAGGIGALAGRISGVKNIIFTAHNWAWNEKRNIVSKLFIVLAHWVTILLCHRVICVSEAIAIQGRRLPFARKKIVVIHNGIAPIDCFDKKRAREILAPSINENGTWIGMISELHQNKGVDIALEAFDGLKNTQAHLLILGNGGEKENLMAQKDILPSRERIHFLGYIENASTYIKAFDLFILPSRNEAFPYVLLEAGLAKIPVIACNVGGVSELILNNKTGILIPKERADILANSIDTLLNDSSRTQDIARNLEQKVSREFSLEQMVQKTIDLYFIKNLFL